MQTQLRTWRHLATLASSAGASKLTLEVGGRAALPLVGSLAIWRLSLRLGAKMRPSHGALACRS